MAGIVDKIRKFVADGIRSIFTGKTPPTKGALLKMMAEEMSKTLSDAKIKEIELGMSALVRYRIHVDGKKANGTPIGKYAASTARRRKAKGLSIDKIILLETGQLHDGIRVALSSSGSKITAEIVVDEKDRGKVEGHDDRFGDVFKFTKTEHELLQQLIATRIHESLKLNP